MGVIEDIATWIEEVAPVPSWEADGAVRVRARLSPSPLPRGTCAGSVELKGSRTGRDLAAEIRRNLAPVASQIAPMVRVRVEGLNGTGDSVANSRSRSFETVIDVEPETDPEGGETWGQAGASATTTQERRRYPWPETEGVPEELGLALNVARELEIGGKDGERLRQPVLAGFLGMELVERARARHRLDLTDQVMQQQERERAYLMGLLGRLEAQNAELMDRVIDLTARCVTLGASQRDGYDDLVAMVIQEVGRANTAEANEAHAEKMADLRLEIARLEGGAPPDKIGQMVRLLDSARLTIGTAKLRKDAKRRAGLDDDGKGKGESQAKETTTEEEGTDETNPLVMYLTGQLDMEIVAAGLFLQAQQVAATTAKGDPGEKAVDRLVELATAIIAMHSHMKAQGAG